MAEWNGKRALITGASSGIGLAFARSLAAQGANLILTARSAERLERAAGSLRKEFGSVSIKTITADLATTEGPPKIIADLTESGLTVDLLINNAGFGITGEFIKQEPSRQQEMLQLNVGSLVSLTHALLPGMISRGTGAIVNVASTAAFQGVPWLSLYAGTKALVLNFTEGLAAECANTGVRVMAFCPGPTESAFHQTAGALPHGTDRNMLSAPDVVAYALTQLERGSVIAIPGRANRLNIFFERFVPRRLVTHFAARVYQHSAGKLPQT